MVDVDDHAGLEASRKLDEGRAWHRDAAGRAAQILARRMDEEGAAAAGLDDRVVIADRHHDLEERLGPLPG